MSSAGEGEPLLGDEDNALCPVTARHTCYSFKRWATFVCIQLPCVVFALTYAVVGVYCYSNGNLVYKDGNPGGDKAIAACNKFRMIMMAAAGSALFISLACTTVFFKICDDSKVMLFIKKTFPDKHEQDWDGMDKGKPPGFKWYIRMFKDLDPSYKDDECCNLTRRFVDCIECLTIDKLPCYVQCLVLFPCHALPCLLFFHPWWWWKRIFEYGTLDFSVADMGDDPEHLGKASMLMTVVFIVSTVWQHVQYMHDDVLVSRFAALRLIKAIVEATAKLENGGTCEKHIDWNEKLGVLVQVKQDLEEFWSSTAVCLPWFTLSLVGVVLAVLGGITGLNTGFFSTTEVGQMAREYIIMGCIVVLFVLFTLSFIASLFCRFSTKTNSVAAKAEAFLGLYCNKLATERMNEPMDAVPTTRTSEQDPAISVRETKQEEYVQSMRRFVSYISKDQIGARVKGVLITHSLAAFTLKTMLSGITVLIIVNKGVLEYMQENLPDVPYGNSTVSNVCTVDRWMSGLIEDKDLCCKENNLFCEEPPQDRKWLKELLGDLEGAVEGEDEFKSGKVPTQLQEALDAAKGYREKLDQKERQIHAEEANEGEVHM